ncbi:MAG TPA: GreA/GreB family elongation factor [Candidatus Paceibacterota bacterium]
MTTLTSNRFYVTKQGLEKVQKEYEKLHEFKRQKTMGEMPSILHSEEANPEYLAFQEDMSLLDARLNEYENILQNAELIKKPPKSQWNEVGVGATVKVDLGGEVDEFTIVGTLEADPVKKKISTESPLGKGLLGLRVGDTVKITTMLVNHDCRILKITYSEKE